MNATTFAALGEPSRLQIVELLRDRAYPVGALTEALGVRQPQVSKHLRVLREAGIVRVEPVARHRFYQLRDEPFDAMGSWVSTFERQWEARLDALDTMLRTREEP